MLETVHLPDVDVATDEESQGGSIYEQRADHTSSCQSLLSNAYFSIAATFGLDGALSLSQGSPILLLLFLTSKRKFLPDSWIDLPVEVVKTLFFNGRYSVC